MSGFLDFDVQRMLFTVPGILIGFAFHEFAHAYVADKLGDNTPRYQGRLTLSPLAHIDIIGFLMIVLVGFGWAKPVQINTRNFKNIRRDDMLVSLAGPAINLIIAVIFSILVRIYIISGIGANFDATLNAIIIALLDYTAWINIILFVFNLLPIPPLDGFHILSDIMPFRNYRLLNTLERYGSLVLILLIITRVTDYIIGIPAIYISNGISSLLSIFF